MKKLIVIAFAVAGSYFVLPAFFPSLNHTAISFGGNSISWSIIISFIIFLMGWGLK